MILHPVENLILSRKRNRGSVLLIASVSVPS